MNAFAIHWLRLFQHRPIRIGEGRQATAAYINSLGLYLQWGVSSRCAYVVKGPWSWWSVNVHSSGHELSPWYLTLKYFEALPHSDASGPRFLGWGHLDLHPWSRFFYLMTAAGERRSHVCHHSSWSEPETQAKKPACVCLPANDKLLNKATCPLRRYRQQRSIIIPLRGILCWKFHSKCKHFSRAVSCVMAEKRNYCRQRK